MEHKAYYHTYETHVKLRWKNKPIIDVLSSEFTTRTREYYLEALECGVITVNDCSVPPKDDFWVVNKPAGIPCHPTGSYFEYSVTRILFKDKTVGCVNRLDMPVSGTLILTFNKAGEIHNLLQNAQKLYIAKVKGNFPEYEEVDQPIGTKSNKMHSICQDGKPSKTIFKNLFYKNGYSLVLCQPITGRTHQIRLHLKYLGYPILNDILYGDGLEPCTLDDPKNICKENIDEFDNKEKYECIIRHCKGANNRTFTIKDQAICLHAWKYVLNGKEYEAKWANF
ncbi:hypothetical protein ACJJTC_016851 [Scirpophaga incertulas]